MPREPQGSQVKPRMLFDCFYFRKVLWLLVLLMVHLAICPCHQTSGVCVLGLMAELGPLCMGTVTDLAIGSIGWFPRFTRPHVYLWLFGGRGGPCVPRGGIVESKGRDIFQALDRYCQTVLQKGRANFFMPIPPGARGERTIASPPPPPIALRSTGHAGTRPPWFLKYDSTRPHGCTSAHDVLFN